jgi:hypothetical protein
MAVNCQTAQLRRVKGFCEVHFTQNDRHSLATKVVSRQRPTRLQNPRLFSYFFDISTNAKGFDALTSG